MVRAISVPRLGMDPAPPAVDRHLNHDGQGSPPAEQGGWHMGCTLWKQWACCFIWTFAGPKPICCAQLWKQRRGNKCEMLKLYGQRLDLRADSVRGFAISLNVRLERPWEGGSWVFNCQGFPCVFRKHSARSLHTACLAPWALRRVSPPPWGAPLPCYALAQHPLVNFS